MIIYKVINKLNGKWYIGKDAANRSYYYGSGVAIKNAINKYGKENFEKVILEVCTDKAHLIQQEKHWIAETNAVNDPMSYNLASGGEGGDLSKYIDYSNRKPGDNFAGRQLWWNNLLESEKKLQHEKQAHSRSKGWYVSTITNPKETYVQNISQWCRENGVDNSMPSALNTPGHRLFQKQTKGWRIRRADMPPLLPYENRRGQVVVNNGCSGKTWKLVNGKRVWQDK